MKLDDIVVLLDMLGTPKVTVSAQGWVRAHCPFALWTHAGSKDDFPSFAIRVDDEWGSTFRCQACNRKGDLKDLVWILENLSGRQQASLRRFIVRDGVGSATATVERVKDLKYYAEETYHGGVRTTTRKVRKMPKVPPILDEGELEPFKHFDLPVLVYLSRDRKLTDETRRLWELGWDKRRRRVTIPIRDSDGKLVGLSKRLFGPATPYKHRDTGKMMTPPKYLHSTGFRRDFFLYGEHLIDKSVRKAILVEGFFDVIYLKQCGYANPLGIMGSYLSDLQKKKLEGWFDEVMVLADGDKAGREMASGVAMALAGSIQTGVAHSIEGKDANSMDLEQIVERIGPPDLAA